MKQGLKVLTKLHKGRYGKHQTTLKEEVKIKTPIYDKSQHFAFSYCCFYLYSL